MSGKFIRAALIALAFALPISAQAQSTDPIAAAIADPLRPDKDRARDELRHPGEVLAFIGIKAGDTVVDFGPGGGYYTRLLSRIAGADGAVYGYTPDWVAAKFPEAMEGFNAAFNANDYPNVKHVIGPMAAPKFDKPADVVFMSQIYHDAHWQKVDVAAMNRAIYEALKPGGLYIVIDHSAPDGTGDTRTEELHRIDAALVKSEVLAAGFVLEAESNSLRNPDDPRTENVFGAIRGKTDQFIYKFRKPAP